MNTPNKNIIREALINAKPKDMQDLRDIVPDDTKWQLMIDKLEAITKKEELDKLQLN